MKRVEEIGFWNPYESEPNGAGGGQNRNEFGGSASAGTGRKVRTAAAARPGRRVLDVLPKSLHNTLRRSQAPNVLHQNLKIVIETLLFYLRHRYLAATECLLFLCLYEMADEAGCGYVNAASLAKRLGRSHARCRGYLRRLERHGLIEIVRDHRCGEDFFRLETAVTTLQKKTCQAND